MIGTFRKKRRPDHPLPRTLMGRYLRAIALRLDRESKAPLIEELRRVGEINSTDLQLAIFPIAVRAVFFHEDNIATIPEFAVEMEEAFGKDAKARETELLIRAALGQPAAIDDIDPWVAGVIKSLTFMRFADMLASSGQDPENFVNPIIIDAERDLAQRGILLTPAQSAAR
jgi:hypothetical protein